MAKTKFYLDARKVKDGEPAPMKIVVTRKGTVAHLETGVRLLPSQWNGESVINHPKAELTTSILQRMKSNVDNAIYSLVLSGEINGMSAADIKRRYLVDNGEEVKEKHVPKFEEIFIAFTEGRKAPRSREIYRHTLSRLEAFDKKLPTYKFEDIDRHFLERFQQWMLDNGNTQNTVNLHFRNIRAVFNSALDDEITTAYPFRKLKIRVQATKDRSLTAAQMRSIFNYECHDWREEYIDIFKLIFLLIGINIGDLANLDAIHSGRIEYNRLKTGKHYSIKVEPEAQAILNKYKGEKYLLSILDKYSSHRDYNRHINHAIKTIGQDCPPGKKPEGEAWFPDLSTYYARYTWATVAAELDIPKETIAAALGHTTMDVTAIYIRTDMKKKIDAANRKVIDYVLYGKVAKRKSRQR